MTAIVQQPHLQNFIDFSIWSTAFSYFGLDLPLMHPGNIKQTSSLLHFSLLWQQKMCCTEPGHRRVGPAFEENPLNVLFYPSRPSKTGTAERQKGVHHLSESGSGRSRTLVPLVLSDQSRASLDMQIYVHTVCVLHRLMVADKKEAKCVVLCMAVVRWVAVLRGFSTNQNSNQKVTSWF